MISEIAATSRYRIPVARPAPHSTAPMLGAPLSPTTRQETHHATPPIRNSRCPVRDYWCGHVRIYSTSALLGRRRKVLVRAVVGTRHRRRPRGAGWCCPLRRRGGNWVGIWPTLRCHRTSGPRNGWCAWRSWACSTGERHPKSRAVQHQRFYGTRHACCRRSSRRLARRRRWTQARADQWGVKVTPKSSLQANLQTAQQRSRWVPSELRAPAVPER